MGSGPSDTDDPSEVPRPSGPLADANVVAALAGIGVIAEVEPPGRVDRPLVTEARDAPDREAVDEREQRFAFCIFHNYLQNRRADAESGVTTPTRFSRLRRDYRGSETKIMA